MKKKTANRVTETLLETAKEMHALGIFNDAEYAKITMRHVDKKKPATAKPLSGGQIRAARAGGRI
jgi:DNA-binding transcriptional regulator YiaG